MACPFDTQLQQVTEIGTVDGDVAKSNDGSIHDVSCPYTSVAHHHSSVSFTVFSVRLSDGTVADYLTKERGVSPAANELLMRSRRWRGLVEEALNILTDMRWLTAANVREVRGAIKSCRIATDLNPMTVHAEAIKGLAKLSSVLAEIHKSGNTADGPQHSTNTSSRHVHSTQRLARAITVLCPPDIVDAAELATSRTVATLVLVAVGVCGALGFFDCVSSSTLDERDTMSASTVFANTLVVNQPIARLRPRLRHETCGWERPSKLSQKNRCDITHERKRKRYDNRHRTPRLSPEAVVNAAAKALTRTPKHIKTKRLKERNAGRSRSSCEDPDIAADSGRNLAVS